MSPKVVMVSIFLLEHNINYEMIIPTKDINSSKRSFNKKLILSSILSKFDIFLFNTPPKHRESAS